MVTAVDNYVMKVNLFISGRKLKDLDWVGKSDPSCILFESKNSEWVMLGRTEQINGSLNPDFTKAFTVDYHFEKTQNLKLAMIDGDSDGDY